MQIDKLAKIELAKRELARRNLLAYTEYTMPGFQSTNIHKVYYEVLNRFAHKEIKNLIITMPPQHGKSEGSSRRLPSFMLGRNPNERIAILSYAASLAQGFNRDNQRIIDSLEYSNLFPNTTINGSINAKSSNGYVRNSTKFQILGYEGLIKSVGRSGQLTGDPVDVAIMDDLYKNSKEGNSPVIREAVIEWYTSVVLKRLHNDSQQLIVFTRWHAEDLIGWLEENDKVILLQSWKQLDDIDPQAWYKINFPALMNQEKSEFDQREMGEALYPEKHSVEKLLKERKLNPEEFESMNQGDPSPKEGMLYSEFKTYTIPPTNIKKSGNYTDTADMGNDYLCSINYIVGLDNFIYITDVYYTQAPQEVTEPAVAKMLKMGRIREADFESNNGGRAFARTIDRLLNGRITINAFHQSGNKESRIKTNSAEVQRKILFPLNWRTLWPEFSKHILYFKRAFKANKHDDCADTLTGVLEYSGICDADTSSLNKW